MKKYTVYKITNNINSKIYIGCHITEDLNDGYMGSGNHIKRAIKKYGIENFTKEYIKVFNNPDEMYNLEAILVNDLFVERKDTYNIKKGGLGGFSHIHDKFRNDNDFKKQFSEMMKQIKSNRIRINGLEKEMKYLRKGQKQYVKANGGTFTGKKHTEESKKKIGQKNRLNQLGKKNSNYGNCWIFNENEKVSKLINKDTLESWIKLGWKKGRKIIF